jgi:hypothetical protein
LTWFKEDFAVMATLFGVGFADWITSSDAGIKVLYVWLLVANTGINPDGKSQEQ